jgi:putative ABC transport system permease protein
VIHLSSSTATGRVVRSLRRSPGFVAIATLSMGIALGISTTIFALMDAMTHPEPPFRDVEQLVRVYPFWQVTTPPPTDSIVAEAGRIDGVERIATYTHREDFAIVGGRVAQTSVGTMSPGAFDLLAARVRLGRLLTQADFGGSDVAVVTDQVWRRDFSNRGRLGDASVQVGERSYRIVGVLASGAERALRADIFIPAGPADRLGVWLLRLKAGESLTTFQPRLRAMNERLTKALAGPKDRGFRASMGPLRPDPLAIRDFHRAMVGAAVCILLIACANVAALMLARGLAKKRDYALRLALGAQPAEVGREVIIEISVLAVIGCAAGVLVTSWFVSLIGRAMPPEMEWQGFVQPQWSWRVLALAMGAVIASIAVAGGFPAWNAARTDPAGPLKEGAANNTGRTHTRFRWLVIAELAIAMTLLMSTSLMQKSIRLMERFDFGYPADRILMAGVGVPWRQDSTTVEDEIARRQQGLEILRRVPGVQSVISGYTGRCGVEGFEIISDRTVQGGKSAWLIGAGYSPGGCIGVGPQFFHAFGLRIVEGRDFEEGDVLGGGAAILDERTAKHLFPNESAIGRTIKLGGMKSAKPFIPVIGVVQNHKLAFTQYPEFGTDSSVNVYVVQTAAVGRNRQGQPRGTRSLTYMVRTGPDMEATQLAVMRALAPLTPENGRAVVYPYNQNYHSQLKAEQFLALVFTLLGLASLLLGAAGLYSVISYVTGQRMREFAVRVALGASGANVAKLVLREAFLMSIGGTAIGAGFGMWAAFLLWNRMWGVYPVDAQALVIAEAVLILTTMAACLAPALRAARSDPLEVMRAA